MKGQAVSPLMITQFLKQESGIDWPGSLLCDWTCRAVAWLGRALLVNSAHGLCISCAEGLLFSPPVVGCAGEAWATPVLAPVRGGGVLGGSTRRSLRVGSPRRQLLPEAQGWATPPSVIKAPPPRTESTGPLLLSLPCKSFGLP